MPRLEPHSRYLAPAPFDPARLLGAWVALGALVLLFVPAADWHNPVIGWLPYWLVLAPSLSLALSRRQRVAAALGASLARTRRRRKSGARRVGTRPRSRPAQVRTAARDPSQAG